MYKAPTRAANTTNAAENYSAFSKAPRRNEDSPFGKAKQPALEMGSLYTPAPRIEEAPLPLLSRAAYDAAAAAPKVAAGYVAPAKRGPEIKSFDEVFPSLNKVIEAPPAAKKSAWSSSSIKAAAVSAASSTVAGSVDRKAEIAARLAAAELDAAAAVAAGRKPRCVVIDISGQSDSDDDPPLKMPDMTTYYKRRAERLRFEAERLKAERRRVFGNYSSEESEESVPEEEEEFYASEEDGAEGDEGVVGDGDNEYEFRR